MHFSADVSPFARRRGEAVSRALRERGRGGRVPPGRDRGGRPGRAAHAGRQALHGVLALPPHLARGAAPGRARGAARAAGPARGACAKGRLPSLDVARARAGGGGAAARRRGGRRASGSTRFLGDDVRELRGQPRRARPRPHLAALALPAPRLRLARARSRSGCRAARERTRSGASSAGATSTTTCCCTSRATRAPSSRSATAARISLEPRATGASTPGARAAPASRSWTPACASCAARAGCTTARGSWSGSFLTKDLGIDWRWGERWFMRLLVDGDEANNNGNWQWIASVGTDPAARLPPHLQPGAPDGAPRPGRRTTCAATCPSCATCPTSTWPSRG